MRTGKVKIEYRNLRDGDARTGNVHERSRSPRWRPESSRKAWDYIELFYHQQGEEDTGYVNEKYLQELAKQVPGLNLATWTADREQPEFTNTSRPTRRRPTRRLHRHAVVPDRQDGRAAAEARILLAERPVVVRIGDQQAALGLGRNAMSPRALRVTMIVLAAIGLGVATYLTYIHYAGIKPLCGTNGGGCEIVQTSQYSKLAGVPVALIGLLGYIAILGSLLVPESETLALRDGRVHAGRLRLQRSI